jgi:flagellar FliL protein
MATPTAEAPKGKTEEAKAAENGKASRNGKSHEEAKPSENGKPAAEDKEKAAPAPAGGGKLKAWLPLIVTVVVMPVLAFATTRYVLLPKLTHGLAQAADGPASAAATAPDSSASSSPDAKGAADKVKSTVQIKKLLVNVAGTMGTRYLMTSLTLVGNTPDFVAKINDNMDQLQDLATGTLASKTISDLEKPGARNVIRAELISVFNSALGAPLVQEIYITEMAIQ